MQQGLNKTVSVILPCLNEEDFIKDCIQSFLSGKYSLELLEIIVIDGGSSDRTIDIVNDLLNSHPNIRLLHNPAKYFPAAVNIGVKASKGEVIIIAGAHATYEPYYISKSVEKLFELNAENVGGVLITEGKNENAIGRLISAILSNPFGVGNSLFRTGVSKITEVDTVFGGCYRREIFDKIGMFNENTISTSDMEFNSRLRRSGGKIFIVPDIKATYYTRSTFKKFIKNNIRNGYWVIYPLRFLKQSPVSMRHLVPLFFVMGIFCGITLSVIFPEIWIAFIGVASIYFFAGIVYAAKYSLQKMKVAILLAPLFFFLLHLSYGLGSMFAAIKLLFLKKKLN